MTAIAPTALDHVALWVADRDAIAALLCGHLGMHEIERTDSFTLVGADARRGKLTLFAAEGPREPGPLARISFHVPDLAGREPLLEGPEGLRFGLEPGLGGAPWDLAGVTLRVPDPAAAYEQLAGLGFGSEDGRLHAGDATIALERGHVRVPERPLLNHLGLKVESAEAHREEAERRGIEIADIVDGPNTLAVFVWGPPGVKLEYVEHKPTFSLV
jgi:catechol 2,3-dioxygenase-like lactoylglutathione lyase family enzyme